MNDSATVKSSTFSYQYNLKSFCGKCIMPAILNTTQFGILALDKDGYIVFINKAANSLLNIKVDIQPRSVHFADIDSKTWIKFKEVLESGEPHINVPYIKDTKAIVSNRYPIIINNKIIGAYSIFSEMKKYGDIENFIYNYDILTKQLDSIIASSFDGIFVTDGKGKGILANSAYDRITGMNSSEQLIGRNMLEVEKEGLINESVTMKVLKSKKRVNFSQTMISGKEIFVTGTPIIDDEGDIEMVVHNVRDMSELNELKCKLERTLEVSQAYKKKLQELLHSSNKAKDLVDVSPAMQSIMDVVGRVTNTGAAIFLYGETGVGKERIAEEIHQRSDRSNHGIFVKINCGAIPESLLETELFGYEKGAFTGAKNEGKPGLFEIADGGTLFLDEIDSLPFSLQAKLLRAVQTFEIRRLGGTTSKKMNVRLICATNKDMKTLMSDRKFRSDLFYRLNVIPIHIPPLRERPKDIPHLIYLFLDRYNHQYSRNSKLSRDCIDAMLGYSWPGNVRELENTIERLVILTHDEYIDISDLPPELLENIDSEHIDISAFTFKEHVMKYEMDLINAALKRFGSARKAADYLQIDPSTLCRKVQNFNRKMGSSPL